MSAIDELFELFVLKEEEILSRVDQSETRIILISIGPNTVSEVIELPADKAAILRCLHSIRMKLAKASRTRPFFSEDLRTKLVHKNAAAHYFYRYLLAAFRGLLISLKDSYFEKVSTTKRWIDVVCGFTQLGDPSPFGQGGLTQNE